MAGKIMPSADRCWKYHYTDEYMLHFARFWEKVKAEGIVMGSSIPLQDLRIVETKGREV